MAKPGGGMNNYYQNRQNNQFRRDNRDSSRDNYNHNNRNAQQNQQNQGGQNQKRNSGNFSGQNQNQQKQQNNQNNQNNQNSNNKQINTNSNCEKPTKEPEVKEVKPEEPKPKTAPKLEVDVASTEAGDDTKGGDSANPGVKKFTGRCRLFVGNLTQDVNDEAFRKLFEPYGEVSEVYVNSSRGFGFIRLDYRHNAEAAKAALDGIQRKGRVLRIRFATHGAALKVKNLHPFVSNELLEQAFSQFGELERCVVIVDDKGKSTGEGIVEFVRKPGASSALRRISEGVFLLGADPKPVQVEPLEQKDEEDGQPEKFISRNEQYKKEREKEPRFAPPGTFEYEFGMRWKQLEELEEQRIKQIKKDTDDAKIKLEDEMQNALYEYQADQIRQDLLRQQEELRRLEELRTADRMRRQEEMERRREQTDRQGEERRRADMMMNLRQQEIASRRGPIDSSTMEMRRREEMMMADRYGDRMDRMGDRGMDQRMDDRGMPDRMSERDMARMQSMREREMHNQGNFNRGEGGMRGGEMGSMRGGEMGGMRGGEMGGMRGGDMGGMRGEAPRGRDQREAGAPPLQPPPVPPTVAGGQPGAANNVKQESGPKPLFPPQNSADEYMSSGDSLPCSTADGEPSQPTADLSSRLPLPVELDTPMETDEGRHRGIDDMSSDGPEGHCHNSLHSKSRPRSSPTHYDKASIQVSRDMCDSYLGKNQDYRNNLYETANESPPPYYCRSLSEERNCGDPAESVVLPRSRSVELSVSIPGQSGYQLHNRVNVYTNKCDSDYHSAYTGDFSYSHSDSHSDNPVNSSSHDADSKCAMQKYYSSENMICENSADSYEMARSPSHDSPDKAYSYKQMPSFKHDESDECTRSAEHYNKETNQNSYSTTPQADDKDKYLQNIVCDSSQSKTDESQYHQGEARNGKTRNGSSYKQSSNEDFDDRAHYDSTPTSLPDVYQSYEENSSVSLSTSHSISQPTEAVIEAVSENPSKNETRQIWGSGVISSAQTTVSSSSVSSTLTSTECSVTDATDVTTVSRLGEATSSSVRVEAHSPMDDHNDAAFTTGDQSFKTAAARQAAIGPFLQNTFAGAPVLQGNMPGGLVSSSSMFTRGLPGGGATFLKQQSLSGAGGAQATLMQQHALPNGVRATSVLQQRTLPNGQTVMVQQRTMTTGLGGLAQQTVVQQHVPGPLATHARAQAAQALTQGMMQQRAVRLAAAGVLGAPVLQHTQPNCQFVRSPLRGALVGPSLVRGAQPSVMQQLVRQRYLGGPVVPGRQVLVAGRPIRVKMTYPREHSSMENS